MWHVLIDASWLKFGGVTFWINCAQGGPGPGNGSRLLLTFLDPQAAVGWVKAKKAGENQDWNQSHRCVNRGQSEMSFFWDC